MNGARLPAMIAWLAVLWVLLWGELTVQNLVAGVGVGLLVVFIAWPTGTRILTAAACNPLAALRYLVYFLYLLVTSNLVVARQVVAPSLSLNRAIVAVPMRTNSNAINTLVANSVTLTPGTLTVDAKVPPPGSGRPTTLYIHVLQFTDADTTRREVQRIERYAVAAFGDRAERAAVRTAEAGGS